MRAALAALLVLAMAPLQAQLILEKPKAQTKEKAAANPAKPDVARPAEPQHKRHSGHPPAQPPPQTRETSEGTVKLDRARPEPQRPTTSPSPAQQYQQQQYEQRQPAQTQRRQNEPVQNRVVQCTARPVCGGAGYGRCATVSQSFPGATLQGGRREIVQRCIEANTPDSCNCAAQCTAVARCSIF